MPKEFRCPNHENVFLNETRHRNIRGVLRVLRAMSEPERAGEALGEIEKQRCAPATNKKHLESGYAFFFEAAWHRVGFLDHAAAVA